MLALKVRRSLGAFTLDVALEAPAGAVTVLVGESGSGKSTLLKLVAGLLEPDEGRIALGDDVLADTAGRRFVAPESRPVGYVAQDYALFPHLNARDNVAFGPRALGLSRAEVRDRVAAAVERFGLAALADRRPAQLSGGQQQRVALARALAVEPAVLLLDEPLAALDVVTRRAVRAELRRVLEGLSCVTLFVTHQPSEALTFGDRIAVLESGRVSQSGSRHDFLREPRSAYVAEFLGVNRIEGETAGTVAEGLVAVDAGAGTLWVTDPGFAGPVVLIVHPHDVVVSLAPPAGSARNVLRGIVEELVPEPPHGDRVRLLLATRPAIAAQVTREAVEALALRPGSEVFASFKATGVRVLPPEEMLNGGL